MKRAASAVNTAEMKVPMLDISLSVGKCMGLLLDYGMRRTSLLQGSSRSSRDAGCENNGEAEQKAERGISGARPIKAECKLIEAILDVFAAQP
jgi:hypothetical protein